MMAHCDHCDLPPEPDAMLLLCACCGGGFCMPECQRDFHRFAATTAVANGVRARTAEHLVASYRVQLTDREGTIRQLVELATRIMGGEPTTFADGLVLVTGRLQCSQVLVTEDGKAVWQQRERAA